MGFFDRLLRPAAGKAADMVGGAAGHRPSSPLVAPCAHSRGLSAADSDDSDDCDM
jgi:hypothetical protein